MLCFRCQVHKLDGVLKLLYNISRKKNVIRRSVYTVLALTAISWGPIHQKAFEHLVKRFTESPLPAIPAFDSLAKKIECVMYQIQKTVIRIIRMVVPYQWGQRRSAIAPKREFPNGFKHFTEYLHHDKSYHLQTDKNLLQYIIWARKFNAVKQRWTVKLSDCGFTIHYELGSWEYSC